MRCKACNVGFSPRYAEPFRSHEELCDECRRVAYLAIEDTEPLREGDIRNHIFPATRNMPDE